MPDPHSNTITIVELDFHVECIYSLCQLFGNTDYNVTILTKKYMYDQLAPALDSEQFKWRIHDPKKESMRSYVSNQERLLRESSLVLFSTLESNFKYFEQVDYQGTTVLRLHNVNSYLRPWQSIVIKLDARFLWKAFSYFVRKILFRREMHHARRMIDKVDYLLFPDEKVEEYARREGLLDDRKVFEPIPMAVFEPSRCGIPDFHSDATPRIIIPGGIDKLRRDYSPLYEAVPILGERLDRPIEIFLIGKRRGLFATRVVKHLKKLECNNVRFRFSSGWMPQEEFLQEMREASFLVGPITFETTYKFFREYYGRTKVSGPLTDMIRYGKPLLIREGYPLEKKFQDVVETFDTGRELADLIVKNLEPQYLERKYNRLYECLEDYKTENVRRRVMPMIREVIQG